VDYSTRNDCGETRLSVLERVRLEIRKTDMKCRNNAWWRRLVALDNVFHEIKSHKQSST
jgi:hypothetical protein